MFVAVESSTGRRGQSAELVSCMIWMDGCVRGREGKARVVEEQIIDIGIMI